MKIERRRRRGKLSIEQQDEVIEAYLAGRPLSEIADEYDVDPSYPRVLARRMGATYGRPENLDPLGRITYRILVLDGISAERASWMAREEMEYRIKRRKERALRKSGKGS